MVRLDLEGGDLAVLRLLPPYGPQDEADYLAALEQVARIDHPFVLLALFGGGPALSRTGDREQALWFKRTRAHMEATCRGCAMVRPGASEASAATFRRLWSFPIHATQDEADARAFLAALRPSTAGTSPEREA
ncbi:MAG: hypothetical protein B7Y75_01535 [Azorhizobium sp. 35-67-5]|nr:MAG: hypothetical protein B7Y75_01535 [Azorhizobium sp. 35-67-5]